MPDWPSLRRQLRQNRRLLTEQDQRLHSAAAARQISHFLPYLKAASVAVYASEDGELDLTPVVAHARRHGKKVYLPVLHPFGGNRLWFSQWFPGDPLIRNRFGIPEPDIHKQTPVHGRAIDLVLMPVVAFDDQLRRLGMGGGYYDRTLAFRARMRNWRKPFLVGVAHDSQRVDACPHRGWDVSMDAVITELKVYRG
jgi:5-formyltetrahydrofolate cyclo-ligase